MRGGGTGFRVYGLGLRVEGWELGFGLDVVESRLDHALRSFAECCQLLVRQNSH